MRECMQARAYLVARGQRQQRTRISICAQAATLTDDWVAGWVFQYDSKMLEKGYDILKSRAKGADLHVVGHLIQGSSGAASPLKAA